MKKNLEGLYGGRVTNSFKIYTTPIFCVTCGKTYIPKDNQLIFKRCNDGSMDFICDKCNEKHNKHWTLKSAEIIPDAGGSGTGNAVCTFEDGRVENMAYGWNNGEYSDIPDHFYDKLREFRKAYHEAKQAALIKTFETVDTFDTQQIIVTQNSGNVITLDYKVGLSGLIFDSRQLSKVTPQLLELINGELKARGMNVGGAK